MKKFSWILLPSAIVLFFSVAFYSCKKINEGTELGSGLIPAVDNINTFDSILDIETNNRLLLHDSTKIGYTNDVALGSTSDPVFGQTTGAVYFDVLPQALKLYPFFHKDSLPVIDSVVLSLSYRGAYGDTSAGSFLSVEVREIAQNAKFNDSSFYRVDHPDFATAGGVLGSKTMAFNQFKDSVRIFRKIGDTIKTANELRIKLDPAFGTRFVNYDTLTAYKNDTIFHSLFSGLEVKATGSSRALAYFNLADQAKTKLTFYYRVRNNNVIEKRSVDFLHYSFGSRANVIRRNRGGDFAAYLNNTTLTDDKLFIQAGSPGSIGTLRIPGLENLSNRVIHNAELIISRIPSAGEQSFPPPPVLFLDRADIFDVGSSLSDDLNSTNASGTTQNLTSFGGLLRSDSTYRFNITRHVQSVITRKETNYQLRLYAPVYTIIKPFPESTTASRQVNVIPQVGYGRVVLAGGNFADPTKRLRLRIIYSNLR
ncbi:MAG: hypothetical protein JWP69_775 [Flaviaesturariibacter sp.]|nr:hypothetical protein [Flaviaesturariibacter sp.]